MTLNGVVVAQKKLRHFSLEFRETAAREVVDKSRRFDDVARDCGVTGQTIRNWVREFRVTHAATDPGLTVGERARLQELERRVRELEEENQFLGKSVAFFARKHR